MIAQTRSPEFFTDYKRASDAYPLRPRRSSHIFQSNRVMPKTERGNWAHRVAVLIAAFLGWVLFFFWWRKVALESTAASATLAVVVLTIIGVAIFYTTLLWIRHNIRLAKRGKRGFSTRYLQPNFERDWLNRPLVFSDLAHRREGAWFVIHADENEKRYDHHRLITLTGYGQTAP
jgi:hypothetical protein